MPSLTQTLETLALKETGVYGSLDLARQYRTIAHFPFTPMWTLVDPRQSIAVKASELAFHVAVRAVVSEANWVARGAPMSDAM
jgi:hypothetical protein